MKRVPYLALIFVLIFFLSVAEVNSVAAGENLAIKGESVLLLEQNSNKILYEHRAHEIMYPASTTKILTALLAIENGDLGEMVTVGPEIQLIPEDSSKAGLVLKERITLADLIKGLLLPSGNDAANAIAVHIGRKISQEESLGVQEAMEKFVKLMNQRAKELGATSSHFVNPHGAHDPIHWSTAYDLAQIAKEAMKHPFFRQVVRLTQYQAQGVLGDTKVIHHWQNTNELLHEGSSKYFSAATGIKTGFTTPAGYCLVSSASKGDLELIAVVLRSTPEGRWSDSRRLLSYGLENYMFYQVLRPGQVVAEVRVANAHPQDSGVVEALAVNGYRDIFHAQDISRLEKEILWNEDIIGNKEEGELLAPLKEGQEIGRVIYRLDGKTLVQSSLVAARNVPSRSILRNLVGGQYPAYVPWFLGLALIMLIFVLVYSAFRPKKKVKLKRKK